MDILEIMERGSSNIAANDDATVLREAAERFLCAYEPFAEYLVIAASPQAERVLGAAMMIQPTIRSGAHGPTVILDVNVASGTLLARAARRLRDGGNSARLVGVALNTLAGPLDGLQIQELSALITANHLNRDEACSCMRQATDGRDGRVLLAC